MAGQSASTHCNQLVYNQARQYPAICHLGLTTLYSCYLIRFPFKPLHCVTGLETEYEFVIEGLHQVR